MRKFVRKYRGAVVAAALAFLALLGGIAGTTWGLFRADDRRQEADQARAAEVRRVAERDEALGKAEVALRKEAELAGERDLANAELNRQLANSNFLLAPAAYERNDLAAAVVRLDKVPEGERGWEWTYLKQRVRGGLFTLHGHTGRIMSARHSPDGTRIVTGADGGDKKPGEVRVWDARTGELMLDIKGHPVAIWSVCFSPDRRDADRHRCTGRYGEGVGCSERCPLLELKGQEAGIRW